jgi:hypothetical protein
MYAWLWRRLPGRTPARAGVLALIIVAVTAALWFFVFPWAALHLPIDSSGLQRLRFKIPVPLGDPLGVTLGEPVSDGGALADAPFCT